MTDRLIFLSGVATSTDFMEPIRDVLVSRLEWAGRAPLVSMLMPYGDWSRRLLAQLNEVRQDLPWRLRRTGHGLTDANGRAGLLAAKLGAVHEAGDTIALIGHSAGGVLAVQTAAHLERIGVEGTRIVQIGSPKVPIPAPLRDRTLYIYPTGPTGRIPDPIVRLGNWGGWRRGRYGGPLWNSRLHAPCHIVALPLIGGHADYFRTREPYRNEAGQTNLSLTEAAIWQFINPIN